LPNPAQFLGNAVGEAAAFAAGVAVAPALHPIVQTVQNEAWRLDPTRPLDAQLIAEAVARGKIDAKTGRLEAELTGISNARFDALVDIIHGGPGIAQAFELWRRGAIDDGQFAGALRLLHIGDDWIAELEKLHYVRLDPAVVAIAVVRGLIPNNGILPVGPPTTVGKVPAFPVQDIDPFTEAAAAGVDDARLKIMAGIAGRPMGPELAARATFRGIILPPDYKRAIAEGDVRNEWADSIFEVSREILTAGQYAELQLRGYLGGPERLKLTEQHGMSDADSDLLYNLLGRSIPVHQITTGEARGGVFDAPFDTIPKAYLQSLQRGNLRPEYYSLAYANRYSLPSAFVLRAITTGGEITPAEAKQLLLEIGWPPELAATVSAAWGAAAGGGTLDPYVKKAQGQLWTAAHRAAVKNGTPRTTIEPVLMTLVPDLANRDAIFQLWDDERALDAGTSVTSVA
jgi:hypothetical protein